MSNIPYRTHHLLQILQLYTEQNTPLDKLLYRYMREHSSIGGQDRREISAKIYAYVRNLRLIAALTKPPHTLSRLLETAEALPEEKELETFQFPPAIRYSLPDALWDLLTAAYGEEKAIEIADAWNTEAPTTIRTNLAKISREALLKRLSPYSPQACLHSPAGIFFPKRLALFGLPEFQEGLFEMQDEASQLVAGLVQVKPGDQVIDFCAGSGGKTLAFAHAMQGKGQIYLHDVRLHALAEAKQRLKRAGIQNSQLILPDSPNLKKLHQKMDWVLVDAPCSGTGTLRRNPDMKHHFTIDALMRLRALQRTIFEKALSLLKSGGSIVYATCSVLPEENEQQIEHFLKTYPLTLQQPRIQTLPTRGGMDGFFAVVFQKNDTPKVKK